MMLAITETTTSSSATVPSVTGSAPVRLKQLVLQRSAGGQGSRDSEGKPDGDERHGLSDDQRHDAAGIGAEGEADADLLATQADNVCDQAIESDGREYQRAAAEHREQRRTEPCRSRLLAECVGEPLNAIQRQACVDVSDRTLKIGQRKRRRPFRLNGDLDVAIRPL